MTTCSSNTLAFLLVALLANDVSAQTIAAGRIIRNGEIISLGDLIVLEKSVPGAINEIRQVVGMESRSILYTGRPINPADIGPPTIIRRNDIVTMIYSNGGVSITTEGRALGRGGLGDRIKVMNISSRTTLSGIISNPGEIRITP